VVTAEHVSEWQPRVHKTFASGYESRNGYDLEAGLNEALRADAFACPVSAVLPVSG
jgi:hypothetical protein